MPMTTEQRTSAIDSVVALLEAVEPLRAELKRCSMIYQYEEKLEAARAWDKPFAYFDVEYRRWARYQQLLFRKRRAASDAVDATGFKGRYCDSPLYRELMGLDRKVLWE